MAGHSEEFLRRAARQRAQQQTAESEVLDAEIVEETQPAPPQSLNSESFGEQVSDYMQSGVFDKSLSQLGQTVDQTDDLMEAHLHDYFEHDLGKLGARTSDVAESILDDDSARPKALPRSAFAELIRALREPASLRQAIILNEILRRPEDRW